MLLLYWEVNPRYIRGAGRPRTKGNAHIKDESRKKRQKQQLAINKNYVGVRPNASMCAWAKSRSRSRTFSCSTSGLYSVFIRDKVSLHTKTSVETLKGRFFAGLDNHPRALSSQTAKTLDSGDPQLNYYVTISTSQCSVICTANSTQLVRASANHLTVTDNSDNQNTEMQ